jgi:hypothetical protein
MQGAPQLDLYHSKTMLGHRPGASRAGRVTPDILHKKQADG